MGRILDLICGVLAIPFFLVGIICQGIDILVQEMLESAMYIAGYLILVLAVVALGALVVIGFREGALEALGRAAEVLIGIVIVCGILYAFFNAGGGLLAGIAVLFFGWPFLLAWWINRKLASGCMKAHGALLGNILKRSQEGNVKDNGGH